MKPFPAFNRIIYKEGKIDKGELLVKVHGIQDIQKMATVLEERKREKKTVKSLLEEKIEKSFKEIIKEKAEE